MADFRGAITVDVGVGVAFDYLADVSHLPLYFSRMTSAEPGSGEEVRTTAKLPDGQEVEGKAWFRTLPGDHRLEWGSEGASAYHGSVDVSGGPDGTSVEVRLHTTRVEDGDGQVVDGIEETLARIKQLVEADTGS